MEHCIFLGYPLEYQGWKCYNPLTKKVVISRDVVFVETELPGLGIGGGSGPAYVPLGSMPDAGGKDSSASGSLLTFNISSDSIMDTSDSLDSDSSDSDSDPSGSAFTPHPAGTEQHSESAAPDPDVTSSSAPSGSHSTVPGTRTAPNAGPSRLASSWIPSPSASPSPDDDAVYDS